MLGLLWLANQADSSQHRMLVQAEHKVAALQTIQRHWHPGPLRCCCLSLQALML